MDPLALKYQILNDAKPKLPNKALALKDFQDTTVRARLLAKRFSTLAEQVYKIGNELKDLATTPELIAHYKYVTAQMAAADFDDSHAQMSEEDKEFYYKAFMLEYENQRDDEPTISVEFKPKTAGPVPHA